MRITLNNDSKRTFHDQGSPCDRCAADDERTMSTCLSDCFVLLLQLSGRSFLFRVNDAWRRLDSLTILAS